MSFVAPMVGHASGRVLRHAYLGVAEPPRVSAGKPSLAREIFRGNGCPADH